MPIAESDVLDALSSVMDPDLHRDIVSLGFVKDIQIDGSTVSTVIELTTPACPVKEELQQEATDKIAAIPGVESVNVTMTAAVRQRKTEAEDLIPLVKNVIAIASGKGGVGKSTVAVNLAIALANTGAKVGLMDADVYGPSVPLMLGTDKEKPYTEGQRIIPIMKYGIQTMSMGYFLSDEQAVLWRGPMVASTVRQLIADVEWGDLDYLLVDLPPGTGDASMSLAQLVPLTGVVIVSTPHNVASNIAGKAVQLFKRLNTPILGVIENMGPRVDPSSGEVVRLFHGAGGEDLAGTLGTPFLGSIPFGSQVSESGDSGIPVVLSHPQSIETAAINMIAGKVAQYVAIKAHASL